MGEMGAKLNLNNELQKFGVGDDEFIKISLTIAEKCFDAENRFNKLYPFHNDWKNHIKNIFKYLQSFIEITDLKLTKPEKQILASSIILHDIGKVIKSIFPQKENGSISTSSLEENHHLLTFFTLYSIIEENKLKEIDELNTIIPKKSVPNLKILNGEAASDETNYFEIIKNNKKFFLIVAWLSCLHKTVNKNQMQLFQDMFEEFFSREIYNEFNSNFDDNKNKHIEDIVKDILGNNGNALSSFNVLAALLQLGDKLDISYKRLDLNNFYLVIFFDEIGISFRKKDEFLSTETLTRWYQFKYTQEPSITSNDSLGCIINIPYRYPENIKDSFYLFRYKAEKDFEDLNILKTLEDVLQSQKKNQGYKIVIQRTENRIDDDTLFPERIEGITNRNERILFCLNNLCKICKGKGNFRNDLMSKYNYYILGIEPDVENKPATSGCQLIQSAIEKLDSNSDGSILNGNETLKYNKCDTLEKIICTQKSNRELTDDEKKIKSFLVVIESPNIDIGLSRSAKIGLESWKQKIDIEKKILSGDHLFHPIDSGKNRIPVSMDIAYLLNVYRQLKEEALSVDDLINISGLDRGRIQQICSRLEYQNVLNSDSENETYRLNKDKHREIEYILKPFDNRRSELVSKVRDIERIGKPLALFSNINESIMRTGIDGLDEILSPFSENPEEKGLPLRKSTLIIGPPGSGKTTLALEIIRQVRLRRLPEETALYLTFETNLQKLVDDYSQFGWRQSDLNGCIRSLGMMKRKSYLEDPDQFLNHILNILDETKPDLVAIDSIGYLLQLVHNEFSREILNRLIKVFNARGITSIFLGEINDGKIGSEAYDVDGVIRLYYQDGRRWIEITKMRGLEFAGGKHPFKIKIDETAKDDRNRNPAIHIFPNIQMLISKAERKRGEDSDGKKEILSSGVSGLDDLLPLYPSESEPPKGFEKGEAILVLGSPGAGKTLLGLHFLKSGFENEEKQEKREKKEKLLWVSFESDKKGLKLATRSFKEEAGFKSLIDKMDDTKEITDYDFKFYPPANLEPHQLVNELLDDRRDLTRLVLDSVTDLEQVFPDEIDFKAFMTSLIHLLREKGVTTMFLYRTKSFFGKTEDIGRVLASAVDTIICLKVLEIHNAVQKGLFLLKVRGREHRSRLLSIEYSDKKGVIVSDRGWTMSGLISGEAGEIREPRVSVKLFYENKNEALINSLIVKEYNRRFDGGPTNFVHVRKPQIYSEFWSFRGSSGAGHSNVRVVSLCGYWATLFHKQDKLYNLWDYVSTETKQLVRKDEFWRRCAHYSHKDHTFNIFSIPNYVDVGVLAFHQEIIQLNSFWKYNKITLDKKHIKTAMTQLTWNMIDEIACTAMKANAVKNNIKNLHNGPKKKKPDPKKSKEKESIRGKNRDDLPSYLFAMPNLTDTPAFVSFFLELYWSFGGVIFDFRTLVDKYAKEFIQDKLHEKGKLNDDKRLFSKKHKYISYTEDMIFVAEILLLVPERIINKVTNEINKKDPNFINDIYYYGDVVQREILESEGKDSNTVIISNAVQKFFERYPTKDSIFSNFFENLKDILQADSIWKNKENLITAIDKVINTIKTINSAGDNENVKKQCLLILYNIFSRIVTNRLRYRSLLRREYDDGTPEDEDLKEIININGENSYAIKTFEFLYKLVKSGLAKNPYHGDFTQKAFLARKWSGDVMQRDKVIPRKEFDNLLNFAGPSDAYDFAESNSTLALEKNRMNKYRIAPLPLFDRDKKEIKGNAPSGKWGYSVFGLWSLGITNPAVSPEIGWIFIDTLTEDKFVEMRAKLGLGLPAKVPAYNRLSITETLPDIYGEYSDDGKLCKDGIVQHYQIAGNECKDAAVDTYRHTRERASIPFYYKIEDILSKELQNFFTPSFFNSLNDKNVKGQIKHILERINMNIKTFLAEEYKKQREIN